MYVLISTSCIPVVLFCQLINAHNSAPFSFTESSTIERSDTITAELVVAASIADIRLSANVAQLMGNA